jgi:hypothetical protein
LGAKGLAPSIPHQYNPCVCQSMQSSSRSLFASPNPTKRLLEKLVPPFSILNA